MDEKREVPTRARAKRTRARPCCNRCRHAVAVLGLCGAQGFLECRGHPPVQANGAWAWPRVPKDGFCDEYKRERGPGRMRTCL